MGAHICRQQTLVQHCGKSHDLGACVCHYDLSTAVQVGMS